MLDNIKRLREKVRVPVVITGESNLRYYTGLGALSGVLLVDKEETLITKDIELAQNAPVSSIVKAKRRPSDELFKILKQKKIKKVGIDLDTLPFENYLSFKAAKIKLVNLSETLADLRAIKSESEISKIAKACEIADRAMEEVMYYLKPGITERELRTLALTVLNSCEDVAFSFIVASGPNSEYTHVYPTERRIFKEEFIIVDLGVKVDGYCSDLTRTFCISPTKQQKDFYNCIIKAQELAMDSIHSNVACSKVYSSVERFFKKEDLLRYWKYGLGHGIGLDIHEPPHISKDSREKLKDRMVFTIEPGIHISDFGGVRIEDTVLLEKLPRKLTKSDYLLEP